MTLQRDLFEAETITIFRLFVAVEWVLLTLALIIMFVKHEPIPNYLLILSWGLATFHLLYLSLRWLSGKLGRVYLPLALVTASVVPAFNQAITTTLLLHQGVPESATIVDTGTFYIGLLLPLLLISLRYGIRTLFTFAGGTSALSVLLSIIMTPHHKVIVTTTVLRSLDRFTLFALAGTIIVLLSQVRRRQQRELLQKNIQLAHYAMTQEQLAVSKERNRMARELHDTLAHTLSALNVQLKATEVLCELDPLAVQKMLQQMQTLTSEGLRETRCALRALRTNAVEEMGLIPALKRLTEQIAQHTDVSLSFDVPSQFTSLSSDIEQHLYRITEEALNNIARHARARRVSVSLCQNSIGTQLTITDDGIGFEVARVLSNERNEQERHTEHVGHYGLLGMQERTMLIHGSLDIQSKPFQGTTIQVLVQKGKAMT
jgi:signal transduction histidine kinase